MEFMKVLEQNAPGTANVSALVYMQMLPQKMWEFKHCFDLVQNRLLE